VIDPAPNVEPGFLGHEQHTAALRAIWPPEAFVSLDLVSRTRDRRIGQSSSVLLDALPAPFDYPA
jgi:hypothetical protein